jgi:hypothetical protein
MIARNITKARQEKKEIIHKLELKKLSEMSINVVAKSFLLYPELKNLDYINKTKV